LRLIDQLTSWHLRVLGLFSDPVEWLKRYGITMSKSFAICRLMGW
jgi:hypothetical protein